MYVSPLTPKQAIALYHEHIAYIERLTTATAPTLTICADPDNSAESIDLTLVREDSLARIKQVLLTEIRRSQRLLEEDLAAGITPAYFKPSPC